MLTTFNGLALLIYKSILIDVKATLVKSFFWLSYPYVGSKTREEVMQTQ